jgi:hypothetical protein
MRSSGMLRLEGSCKNRHFEETYRSVIVIMTMEAIRSSETWILTRTTRRNILEDDILRSRFREILKSYIVLNGWAL